MVDNDSNTQRNIMTIVVANHQQIITFINELIASGDYRYYP